MADGSSGNNLVSSRPLSVISENAFDFFCCTVCQDDGRCLEAVGYCSDCMDYLCRNCFNSHCRPRPMRHHTLLDKESMLRDKDKARKMSIKKKDKCTEVCPNHPDKVIEYYCPAHDALGCNVCSTMDHRLCTGLTYIPGVAEGICDSEEFKQVTKELDTMADCSRRIIDVAKDNASLSNTFHSDVVTSLKEFKNEINTIIDQLVDGVKAQADKIKSEDSNNLAVATTDCNNVLREILGTISRLATLQNDEKYCSIFFALKKAKATLQSFQTRLYDAEANTNIREYKFLPNVRLTQFLQAQDVIGKISVNNSASKTQFISHSENRTAYTVGMRKDNPENHTLQHHRDVPDAVEEKSVTFAADKIRITPHVKTSVKCASSTRMNNSLNVPAHAKLVGDINVRSDVEACWITGSVVLAPDKLVVTDFKYYNSTVKVVDTRKNKLKSYIKVSSPPWDITAIATDKLAVTLPDAQEIVFLNLSKKDKLREERKIKVNGECHGIVYTKDMLIVSYLKPGKVEFLTLNGDVQRSISMDASKRPLFPRPYYIALSHDQNTLFVSDRFNDTVTSLTLTGEVKAVYKDIQLRGPTGIVTDSKDRVYICGWGANNIHVLAANFETNQVLLSNKDGLDNLYSVSFCESTKRLYVGQGECNTIKVYQL